jgi:hypothetical protein
MMFKKIIPQKEKAKQPGPAIVSCEKTLVAIQSKKSQRVYHVPITFVGSWRKRIQLGVSLDLNSHAGKSVFYYGPRKNQSRKSFIPPEATLPPSKGSYKIVKIYRAA